MPSWSEIFNKFSNTKEENKIAFLVAEKQKRKEIMKAFNNNDATKVHSRHISKEQCKAVGLNIIDMEGNQHLQDMILSLHHCYMIYLEQTM